MTLDDKNYKEETSPDILKTNSAQYQRLHVWVRKNLGNATHCSIDKSHKTTVYHWANISGEYRWNLSDFRQLCPTCHKKQDGITEEIRELKRKQSLGNTNRRRGLIAIDRYGVKIEFPSAHHAQLKLGILRTSISNCLSGRSRTAGGYKWRYKGGVS